MSTPGTVVWVTARLPGWHRWPAAPSHRAYLSVSHRHLFHVRVTVPVTHDERDVEFHDLLDVLHLCWQEDWQAASCEAIARTLAGRITTEIARLEWIEVEVAEDGEAGATYVHVQDR